MQRHRAGNGATVGFQRTFERHLVTEQRKAVLGALASQIDLDATVGEVLDAAEALGWSDGMGDLSLADLADALLGDGTAEEDNEPAGETEADHEAVAEAAPAQAEPEATAPKRGKKKGAKKKAKAASAKTAAPRGKKKGKKAGAKKKAASKKTAAKSKKKSSKTTSKKSARGGGKKGSKRAAARLDALRAKLDADEPMSLDEAAEVFVPIVAELGNATMQDLEDATGLGRRKLRFHIGQLVRHDYLQRHGMGRGTYYTAA